MDLDQIKRTTRRFPRFLFYSLEGKIKPLVEFLLELGVQKSDIRSILSKKPQLCGFGLSENIIPTMTFLEGLGVEKKQWAKLICFFPSFLGYSRQKVKTTVDFLHEMGLSAESIGKILTQFPQIIGCSVEDKLRPIVEYFCFLWVDVAVLFLKSPSILGSSLEINLIPKWEFFLTMDYPQSELVKRPAYFACSLEQRIKPMYAHMKECVVVLSLSTLSSSSSDGFEKALRGKLQRKTS